MRHTPEAGAVCGNSASRSLNLLIQSGNGGSMSMFTGFPSLDHAEKIFRNFYSEPPPDTPRARWHPGQPLQVPGLSELRRCARTIIGAREQ